MEILKKAYASREAAGAQIPVALEAFYRDTYPAIYNRNVFPAMKVNWGSYPNNIGHTDFPGCFRCHDDSHASADGRKVTQDCSACHNLLAVEEAAPKILTELGVVESTVQK